MPLLALAGPGLTPVLYYAGHRFTHHILTSVLLNCLIKLVHRYVPLLSGFFLLAGAPKVACREGQTKKTSDILHYRTTL